MNSPVKRYIPIGFVVGDKEYLCSNYREYNLLGYTVLDMVDLSVKYHSFSFYKSNKEKYIYLFGEKVGTKTKVQLYERNISFTTYDGIGYDYALNYIPLYTKDLKVLGRYKEIFESTIGSMKFSLDIPITYSKPLALPVSVDILTLEVTPCLDYDYSYRCLQSGTRISDVLNENFKLKDTLALFKRDGVAYKYGSVYYYDSIPNYSDLVLNSDCEYVIIDKVSRLGTIILPKDIKVIELHKDVEKDYSYYAIPDKLLFHKDTDVKVICHFLVDFIINKDYDFASYTDYVRSVGEALISPSRYNESDYREFIRKHNEHITSKLFNGKLVVDFY